MRPLPASHVASLLSIAAVAALPTFGLGQTVKTFTGGTAQNGTAWTSTGNWDVGSYAGSVTMGNGGTAPSGGGAIDDIAYTAATNKVTGFGINFGTADTRPLFGGTLTLGSLIYNTTALGSAGTSGTMSFGNVGVTPAAGNTNITGTVAFTGSTVNVGATGGTLNNIVAAITDTATSNLTLTNQSVNTSTFTAATLTYQLNNLDSGMYAAAGRTLRVISNLTEQNAGTTLHKYGAGTLELGAQLNGIANSGVNTFSNLDIHQGLMIIDGGLNSLGSATGTVTIRNGSELRFNWNSANIASTKSFALDGGGVINNNSYVVTIQGAVTGTGGLTKTGAASLTLNNTANNFTGGLTIGNGTAASTVTIGTAGALGAGTNTTTINNGSTLAFNAISGATQTVAATRTVSLAGTTGNISVVSGEVWTLNAAVTGPGTLVKTGAGSLNLNGPTSYTGGTTVSTGNLYINTDQTGIATGNATVATGAQLAGSGKIGAANIGVGGVISAGTSSNVVANLVANGNVTLTDGTTAGTYKHDFSSAGDTHESFTVGGAFDLTGGTLQFTNLAAAGEASYTVATAGTLNGTFANVTGLVGGYSVGYTANSITLIRGNTTLYFTGAQGTDLGTAANFSPDLIGNVATDQFMTASADVTFGAAVSNTNNFATTIGANSFVNSLKFDSPAPTSISQAVAGTGTLTIKAAGINNAAGTGILVRPSTGAVTIAAPVSIAAGQSQSWTNQSSNVFTVSNTVALGANTLTLDGTGNHSLTGVITGTGGLTKSGTGTATLTGANTYTGTTTVTAGTLKANTAATSILLTVTGGVDLQGGKLVLDYTGGTSPVSGVKSILDAGYAGGFATGQIKASTLTAGRTIGYGDNGVDSVTLRVTLGGDADLDGDVDFNDFLALQSSFGTSGTRFDQGNFNYDGATDFNDFLALQGNFGQSIGGDTVAFTSAQVAAVTAFGLDPANQSVVPEPASLALLGLGAAGLMRRRRAN